MKNEFDILNTQFIGYGNPNGKYWFVGIEGAESFDKYDIIQKFCKDLNGKRYIPDEPGFTAKVRKEKGNKYTKVYEAIAKIVLMHREGKQEVSIDEANNFVDHELFMESSDNFQINLFPLGKKKVNYWEERYNDWFGFKNKKEYLSKVKEKRFPEIRTFVESKQYYNPGRIIICFGVTNLDDYKKALGADFLVQSEKSSRIYTDQKHRLLVVAFPAYGWLGDHGIKDIVQIMNEFGG